MLRAGVSASPNNFAALRRLAEALEAHSAVQARACRAAPRAAAPLPSRDGFREQRTLRQPRRAAVNATLARDIRALLARASASDKSVAAASSFGDVMQVLTRVFNEKVDMGTGVAAEEGAAEGPEAAATDGTSQPGFVFAGPAAASTPARAGLPLTGVVQGAHAGGSGLACNPFAGAESDSDALAAAAPQSADAWLQEKLRKQPRLPPDAQLLAYASEAARRSPLR